MTRGPRLMMPAGLGGLIATVDCAQSVPAMSPAMPFASVAAPMTATQARKDVRVPTLPWLEPARAASLSALDATTSSTPAALSHVAWSDCWLARFSGASTHSLDVLEGDVGVSELRMQALAAAAPEAVFVAPAFTPTLARSGAAARNFDDVPAQASAMPSVSAPVQRYADDDETPDSVFEQIAASAASSRVPVPAAAQAAQSRSDASIADQLEQFTFADALVRGAPTAPGAGLSAQLASSPFAPALKHLLPLPASTTFDVRSLFGAGVSATYLAGLLAAESHEVGVAGAAPSWTRWAAGEDAVAPMFGERMAPGFEAAYVVPESPVAANDSPPGLHVDADVIAPLTTLRTALLSWTSDTAATTPLASTIATTQSEPVTHATARAMLDALTLPMLGDTAHEDLGRSWAMPGMIGIARMAGRWRRSAQPRISRSTS